MEHSTPDRLPDRHSPSALRAWLAGEWRLDRVTDDRLGGQRFHLAGLCRFDTVGADFMQQESGLLRLENGQEFPAEQRYIWRFADADIWLHFMDNRPFIRLTPPFTQCDSHHLCGRDDYSARFEFGPSQQWSSRWQVNGPRKNYVMTSHYRRVG